MSTIKKIFRKLRFNRNNHTRFNLILRNWGGISDVDVLRRALETETFRSYVKHSEYEPQPGLKFLVLAPHQDDEVIGAGGLLLKAKSAGAEMSVCFITNGAQNNLAIDGKKYSPVEVAKIRKKEALEVCKKIGAEFHELDVDNVTMDISSDHVKKLSSIISSTEPDILLCPWIFDGSAKHRVVNQLLFHALQEAQLSKKCDVWGYQVNNPIFSNVVVNITAQMAEKNELMEKYTSQNIGIKNYAHLATGLSAWNSRYLPSKKAQGEKQYAEIFMALGQQEFNSLIQDYYLNNLAEIYFGDMGLINKMKKLT